MNCHSKQNPYLKDIKMLEKGESENLENRVSIRSNLLY